MPAHEAGPGGAKTGRRRRGAAGAAIAVAVLVIGALTAPALRAAPLPVPGTGVVVKDAQPDYGWDPACGSGAASASACYVSVPVSFPSRRSGAVLAGTLYGPPGIGRLNKVPAVVVIPPSGGAATQGSVSYLAKYLAVADGYVGLTVDPQGIGASDSLGDPPCATGAAGRTNPSPCPNAPYQQMDNFFEAGQSALDFLASPADPWRSHIDLDRIGAAGHSEGARAATYLQDPAFDGRVKVVVALDNLTTNYCGDAGTPSNEGPAGSTGAENAAINGQPYCLSDPEDPGSLDSSATDPRYQVRAVAPALGIASDGPGGLGYNYPASDPTPQQTEGPDTEKETAALAWKAAHVPSAELVLAGVNHDQFSQSSTSSEVLLHTLAVYGAAWFQAWLGRDHGALSTFRACSVLGQSLTTLLSTSYLSGVYVPGADTGDLRADCGG